MSRPGGDAPDEAAAALRKTLPIYASALPPESSLTPRDLTAPLPMEEP